MSESISNGINVQNDCYECMVIARDMAHDLPVGKCQSCQDLADARLTDVAHEIVDEGNLQYKHQWLLVTEPSGHDWTERDDEFRPSIVFLQDGGVYEELWELDDMRQRSREVQCHWCNLLVPKHLNDCASCDKPLELNVRQTINKADCPVFDGGAASQSNI